MKHLHALVHSRDTRALASLQPVLDFLGISAEVHADEQAAVMNGMRRHFDGFIVDFTDGLSAKAIVAGIRSAPSNQFAPVIALVKNKETLSWAEEVGIGIVFPQPVSVASLRGTLKIALLSMAREHLRYFRHRINTPAFVRCADHRVLQADTVNVSNEGLGLRLSHPTSVSPQVRVRFQLPVSDRAPIDDQGRTAWSNSTGHVGIRFDHMPKTSREQFQRALGELNSRARLDLVLHCF